MPEEKPTYATKILTENLTENILTKKLPESKVCQKKMEPFDFENLPIDIKISILKKVVGADRKELENIQQVHSEWLFITKSNDFMKPIFGKFFYLYWYGLLRVRFIKGALY